MHVIITTDWSHFVGAAKCGGAFVMQVVNSKTSQVSIRYTRANMNRCCSATGELFVVLNALIGIKYATRITIRTDQLNIHMHLHRYPVFTRFRGIDIHWKYLPKKHRDLDDHFVWCHRAAQAAVKGEHTVDVGLPVPVGLKQLSRLWYDQSELSRMEDTSGGDNPAATSPD